MARAAKLDLAVARELRHVDRLGLVKNGEVFAEVELAHVGTAPGALIVTDQRILFVRTALFRRRTSVISLPIQDVTDVDTTARAWPWRKMGVLAVGFSGHGSQDRVEFQGIPGGLARAEEIARTILRQRQFLREPSPELSPVGLPKVEAETAEKRTRTDVRVGRGVASYVRSHGGRLYVWGEPFGRFDWLKASTEPPDDVDFIRVSEVSAFELLIERDLVGNRPVRLARRWWSPRGGIMVDTGLVLGS